MLNKFTVVLLVVGLSGCSLFGNSDGNFRSSKAKWALQDLSDYAFEIQISCFCIIATQTPALVTVRDDTVSLAVRISDNAPIGSEISFVPTIEELFDIIDDARDGGADEIETTYHRTIGYPVSIDIDYID